MLPHPRQAMTDAPPPKPRGVVTTTGSKAAPGNPFHILDHRGRVVPTAPEPAPAPAPAVEPVRIGVNERWVFVLRPQEPLSVERLRQAKAELERWWASGEKFCVVGILPGVDVRLQRVDE